MRTLVAAALLAHAKADETSLMQRHTVSGKVSTDGKSSRQDSTAKLLETAVSMIKNGVTPDVITFVDSTNQEINEEVLAAIQREHDTDQAYIHSLCQDFLNAVQTLEDKAAEIALHDDNRLSASEAHQNCRKEEAFACAHSRRCEEQLRQKWVTVKHEESIMREIHGHIHDEWCIHPPFFAEIDVWLTNPFNWADMSPYPILDLPQDVRDFRQVSVTHFNDYMAQKIVVERAWHEYNEKLVECSGLEEVLEEKIPICDQAQITLREHACQHAVSNREAREEFGQEWDRINRLYDEAVIAKSANEQDRKNEWETLKIVQCLLDHVHSTVVESIETGAPCPTIDSDEEGVTLAIEDCHIVTRGCDEGSMTAHLCLEWCEKPPIPPLPPVEEPACTPAYIAREQGSFLEAIQASYNEMLSNNAPYPDDALTQYNTILSPAGWAGCAAPLVCVDCAGLETVLPVPTYENTARTCHLHEEYLAPGQSNFDSFRCLDGTCIGMEGRCNGYANCGDESDEMGCDAETEVFVPAYLAQSIECPADFLTDVYFQCANSRCVEKIGLCNGHDNCGDNSDEAHCSGAIHVTTEATSGRTITVETLQSHTGVFHDREYSFESLGDFAGKPFIKYSNDDKHTDHAHVMTKLRTEKPLTVFIVKLDGHSLPWLEGQGFAPSSHAGLTFSGVRETRHKEWDPSLLTTDSFTASAVYSKTFEAGTISIPGNNGGDGSFLVFLAEPGFEPRPPVIGEPVAAHMAVMGAYPGYSGNLHFTGGVAVSEDQSGNLLLSWHLSGLEADACRTPPAGVANACGIHVHSGTTCDDASGVGGHYFHASLPSDPWSPVVYTPDASGKSDRAGYSLGIGHSLSDVVGRAIVVHDHTGARVACGIVGAPVEVPLYSATMSTYPGYSGNLDFTGSVAVTEDPSVGNLLLSWHLSGLEAELCRTAPAGVANACGIHVHSGTTCADASGVGGHYYHNSMPSDPWSPVVYTPDALGNSERTGYNLHIGHSLSDVVGRAIVVHDHTGARVACGIVEPGLPIPPPVANTWVQHLNDNMKCNPNEGLVWVPDQAACQVHAVTNGHAFYSFRHNGERPGHKCFSSSHCDSPLTGTGNEWNIYTNEVVDEPQVCCRAMTAECLACAASLSVVEYCEAHTNTPGCLSIFPPPPPPVFCCRALTADCLACSAGQLVEEYCAANPSTRGCEPEAPTLSGPIAGSGWNNGINGAYEVSEGSNVCGISFQCNTPTSHLMVGFAHRQARRWQDLDYGITCRGSWSTNTDLYENGRHVGQKTGRRANGNPTEDVHALHINTDGQVEYSVNGEVYHTSSRPVTYPWHVAIDTYNQPSLSGLEYLPCEAIERPERPVFPPGRGGCWETEHGMVCG